MWRWRSSRDATWDWEGQCIPTSWCFYEVDEIQDLLSHLRLWEVVCSRPSSTQGHWPDLVISKKHFLCSSSGRLFWEHIYSAVWLHPRRHRSFPARLEARCESHTVTWGNSRRSRATISPLMLATAASITRLEKMRSRVQFARAVEKGFVSYKNIT